MPIVRMYSTQICPYCVRAERLLSQRGAQIDKILIDKDPTQQQKMIELTGRRTVPQIFIGERHVGGYDDLVDLDMEGELEVLLQTD
ncbi:MAG: glutaredoxin 3 [Pseudomonadota bacterium]|nr:glutaredoxin 3 [Pseudomonadota bacterium]